MFCRYCGEENPEEAIYCRNCGKKLEEEVIRTEVIETPKNNNQNTSQSTTTSSSSNKGNSDWVSCCLCLIGIFIVFAIIGSF